MNFTTHPSFAKLPFRPRPRRPGNDNISTSTNHSANTSNTNHTYSVPGLPDSQGSSTPSSLALSTPALTLQTISILHSRLDSACRIAQLQTAFQDEIISDIISYTQENFGPKQNNHKRCEYIVTEGDMSRQGHILAGRRFLARIAYYNCSVRQLREFLEEGVERYLAGVGTNEAADGGFGSRVNNSPTYVFEVVNIASVNPNENESEIVPCLFIPLTDPSILWQAQQVKSRLRQLQLYLRHYTIFAMNSVELLFSILFTREENPSYWLAGEIETHIAVGGRRHGGVLILNEGQPMFWYRRGMENTLMRAELFGLIRRRGWNQGLHDLLVHHGQLW